MARRIVDGDEQDVHTSWRSVYCWTKRAGATASVKRRTNRRERREAESDIAEQMRDDSPVKAAVSKKDTQRWCRGKPGVEHDVTVSRWSKYPCDNGLGLGWLCSHQVVCTACGKVVQWSLGDGCPDRRVLSPEYTGDPT